MSAYTTIRTQLCSPEHILRALGEMGFHEVEFNEAPRPLVGWLGDSRQQTAEIIIRKAHIGASSNDIGFKRNPDGTFTALISDFDRRRFNPKWPGKLSQRYAYNVAKEKLGDQGFEVVEENVDQTETVRLTLRRSA